MASYQHPPVLPLSVESDHLLAMLWYSRYCISAMDRAVKKITRKCNHCGMQHSKTLQCHRWWFSRVCPPPTVRQCSASVLQFCLGRQLFAASLKAVNLSAFIQCQTQYQADANVVCILPCRFV